MSEFNSEEIADLLYCLKQRREQLFHNIKFFNEIIRDRSGKRLDILEDCVSSYRKELDKLDLIIIKVQGFL